MATLDIKDSVELLADFIEKAIIEEHSSFVGVAYIPAGDAEFVKSKHQLLPPSNTTKEDLLRRYQKRRNLPEPPDIHAETVDLSGKTLAHVMSITKAIMGLLWAERQRRKIQVRVPPEPPTHPHTEDTQCAREKGPDADLGRHCQGYGRV